ncbi:uncharacterized protein LOC126567616 [Anopheles maculipalpis]|uniref:uncharacterized protein LOC126567616 n=1 Tax=Anopheles maculipalpis TaxID=1496333 RepID=UPI00215937DF|nr:uncharacterized protein LOC126567616 [Anopheles maculipalpis]
MFMLCVLPMIAISLLSSTSMINCFMTTLPILNRIECKFDERLVNMSCFLGEPNSYTNQSITIEIEVQREIKEVKVTATYYVVNAESTNRILSRTVDICTYVKRPNMDRLIKVFYDQVLQNNRFVSGCPVQAKEQFFVHDLRPSAIRIPGFLPESSFVFENTYHTGVLYEAFIEVRHYGKLMRFVNIVLWLDVGSGTLQAPFYNQTIDFCSLLKNPGSHRMVQIVYREMRRHGNMPTGCPIPAVLYKFHGISTSQMRLPPFFTQTDFMVDIIGLTGTAGVRTIEMRWYGVVNKVKCTATARC